MVFRRPNQFHGFQETSRREVTKELNLKQMPRKLLHVTYDCRKVCYIIFLRLLIKAFLKTVRLFCTEVSNTDLADSLLKFSKYS